MTENPYLVGLRLAGKKVVVVGGGTVAQRRLPLLIASGADVHVIAPSVTPAVEAMDQITLSVRDYRDGDLDGAWYAIAATDDARVNVAVVAEAERRRIFCVRADIAVEGTAVTPASFSYAGLSVGVLAGGEHGGRCPRPESQRCRTAARLFHVRHRNSDRRCHPQPGRIGPT